MAFRARFLLPSLSLALVLACQAPPGTMTVVCSMNSDCPPRLVCNDAMRCVVECVSQHDCLRGTHCAVWDEIGSCVIDTPLDHTSSPCNATRACESAETTCRDFSCWSPCTTGDDCVPDSYCRHGVCANPDSPGFGYGVRIPCASASECGAGEICATDRGSESVCRRPCTANADCADVAADAICATIDDPSMPAGTMACAIGCDPVRQLGCYDRDRCEVNLTTGPGGAALAVLDCRAPTGTTIQGVSCGTTEPMLGTCAQDLGCAPAMADMTGGYECRRFCTDSGDCRSATLACTGPPVMGIQNTHAVVGVLHMCEAM